MIRYRPPPIWFRGVGELWSSRAGIVAGLGQEEQADLFDVRSGGNVDEVVLVLDPEGVAAGELVEAAEDFVEVPRVGGRARGPGLWSPARRRRCRW